MERGVPGDRRDGGADAGDQRRRDQPRHGESGDLAIPLGLLTIGPLSQSFGPYAVITVSGLLFIVIAVLPLAAPAVRELPHTAPER
ncbi:hypothetical protein [Streptomyces buecherae]|uniref:hypothetical protein n=1 Tax=Streptomyces buecherae TaxID=2763006 RepID=UPI001C251F6C|nr:hypothetical protein [Streptomyces buecherae]